MPYGAVFSVGLGVRGGLVLGGGLGAIVAIVEKKAVLRLLWDCLDVE